MKKVIVLVILILLSLPIVLPLFSKGMFLTDDGESMIIRSSAFHQSFRDGQFPVRFLGRLNNEYGYPVSTFLYPGFLYMAEPLYLLQFDEIASIKIMLGLSIIFSGVFLSLWLRKFFDKTAAVIGALIYVYAPYHLYDLYTRGSVGELLAFAIVPFVLWQLERKSLVWSSFGVGLLILSHNTLGLLFVGLISCYLFLDYYLAKKKTLTLFLPILFGVGLAAFFWIPALAELQYTVFSQTKISNWENHFAQPSLIGYITVICLVLPILLVITKKLAVKKHRLTIFFFTFGIVSLFLATSLSYQLWTILPVSFVQFPFRFLSVTLLCISFLAAGSLSLFQGKQKLLVAILLLGSLLFSSYSLLMAKPHFQPEKDGAFYSTNMATTTVLDEYLPVWVKEKPTNRAEERVAIVNGKGIIKTLSANNKQTTVTVSAHNNVVVTFNTIYWPGWKAIVDGKTAEISYNNSKGLITVAVPQGNHSVKIFFTETPLRLFSDDISFISLVGLFVIVWKRKNKIS